ncbi:flagellar basal body L-ring protein FlgH [Dyella tabacisoli]|uniref:Flagellar basal body L-ring protein FlgH n=2 Tax=Dyella tabacisoli TaxID=2282381 RepID=A0A369UP71_9GAMM|nr:flagellar basal body L-ring protein FlgH [Dyella tabacisoli]
MVNPDSYRGLAADRRAHLVGDTLTVVVTETAQASASANTDASSGVQLGANTQTYRASHNYGVGLSGSDAGQGRTSRVGMLQAQLTVRVVDLEGDGMLRIRGEQTVVVNGEKQQFALTGLVRAEDISATNVIVSNRISEAKIEFTGQGDVSESQRRSILYRITRWLHLI